MNHSSPRNTISSVKHVICVMDRSLRDYDIGDVRRCTYTDSNTTLTLPTLLGLYPGVVEVDLEEISIKEHFFVRVCVQ